MKVSDDGLVRSNNNGSDKFVDIYNQTCKDMDSQERQWVAKLREQGIKLAHPNDGWVNRENNSLYPCYPQFNDNPQVGDKIVMGWASSEDKQLLAEVISIEDTFMLNGRRYFFKYIDQEVKNEISDNRKPVCSKLGTYTGRTYQVCKSVLERLFAKR